MDQDALRATFRQAELKRRKLRQARLLNEAKLADEPLSPEDEKATAVAIERITEQRLQYELATTPHFPSKLYWKRLWSAVRGRP
jgi:hypothetical protein